MKYPYLVYIFILLILGVTVIGDVISSSITCDGSAKIYSSSVDPYKTYKLSAFTTEPSKIERQIFNDNDITTISSIVSEGLLEIDEYIDQNQETNEKNLIFCLFGNQKLNDLKDKEVSVSGIIKHAGYASFREIGLGNFSANTLLSGSGLMMLRKHIQNMSKEERDFLSIYGNMTISDSIQSEDD